MTSLKKVKVIFDTNIWISFLIGRRLSFVKQFLADAKIELVLTDQLLIEIELVTQRPKLKKYFDKDSVKDLLVFLKTIGRIYPVEPKHQLTRDLKDSFLLDLIEASKAHFLVTGDSDLLEQKTFQTANIISPKEFEAKMK